MKKEQKHLDAAGRQSNGRAEAHNTAAEAAIRKPCHVPRFLASSVLASTLALASAGTASAQFEWDSSWSNPFVVSGNAEQCTAYAWGRWKTLTGDSLQFTSQSERHGGRFYQLVVETPTIYRDTAPVRGSLVSWTKLNDYGHVAVIERINNDGSFYISEGNWGERAKTISAAQLVTRTSRLSNGTTATYNLAGFVCPNRPPALGTIFTNRLSTNFQIDVALLDEDGRNVRVMAALFDGTTVVGNTINATVTPNRVVQLTWPSPRLTRGRTYKVNVWVWDWRGLRSTKSAAFMW